MVFSLAGGGLGGLGCLDGTSTEFGLAFGSSGVLDSYSESAHTSSTTSTAEAFVTMGLSRSALSISASADGGPRSRVRARGTLRSAPHRH